MSFLFKNDKDIFIEKCGDFIKHISSDYKSFKPYGCMMIPTYQSNLDNNSLCDWSKKYDLKSKFKVSDTSTIHLHLAFYHFESQKNLNDAKNSLFNCFPLKCNKVSLDSSNYRFMIIPSIYIINKKEIITCHSHFGQTDNSYYDKVKNELIQKFKSDSSIIITSTPDLNVEIKNSWH